MKNKNGVNPPEPTRFDRFVQLVPVLRGVHAAHRGLCDLSCDEEPKDGGPIFVTVHGTWVRDAAWTKPQSKLLNALKMKWPCAGTYRFRWSGLNGACARIVASEVLSERLAELAVRYPSSKIITVSHSHGGNVVAWASTVATHPLTAAVYLNTPFIQVQRQSHESSFWLGSFLFGLPIWLLLLLGWGTERFLGSPFSSVWGTALSYLAPSVAAIACILMPVLVPRRMKTIRDQLADLSNCKRNVGKELVVLVAGDEAAAFLTSNYFIQRAAIKLISVAYTGIIVFLILLARIWPSFIENDTVSNLDALMLGILFTVLLAVSLFVTTGQGIVQGLIGLDSSVATTPAPIGETEFATVSWIKKDKIHKFRHSGIYETQETIDVIIRWLCGRQSGT